MKNEYRLMNLINDGWVIVAEGDIDTCQEYDPEPQYQLIRKCEGCTFWQILIVGCMARCKECQEDDDIEYVECPKPEYKIISV
jgi:hypothetical protein